MSARLHYGKEHERDKFELHVDVDEKLFYMYSYSGKHKLPPGKDKPKTRLKSKRFVGKVMCLTAIARPNGKHKFDGKVGCWRVTGDMVYKRSSTYKGTTYKKGDKRRVDVNMDGPKFAEIITKKVFPAIRQKLKGAAVVKVQFDNAGPHKTGNLSSSIAAALPAPKRAGRQTGPRIQLIEQPAQSPETNANDLGFYKSIDSQLPKKRDFDPDKFEQQILDAFDAYDPKKLDAIFDMKSRVCKCLIDANGSNDFKLPHRTRQSE